MAFPRVRFNKFTFTLTEIAQIVSGEDSVRGPAKKFFLERLADSDRYVPTLQADEKLKAFIIEQVLFLHEYFREMSN